MPPKASSVPAAVDPATLDPLVQSVARRPAADQTRLVMGVADLYRDDAGVSSPAARQRLESVFTALVRGAEARVRQGLAQRLGSADWLPHSLVRLLASDEIDIARPVISSSPLLTDDDLLHLLAVCPTEHRLQVALRPGVGEAVCTAILDTREPLLLTALASNPHARLPADGMSRLVDASETITGLRRPLIDHPALSEALAEKLYRWVGETLRQALVQRFPDHAARLEQAVGDTISALNDARLAARLHDTGRLTAGSLLRILREGRRGLFLHGLALLAEVRTDEVDILLGRPSARQFYLACLAAGIDRAAFPEVLEGLRRTGLRVPPALIDTELRLGERDTYQAKLELRALMDSLLAYPVLH